MRPRFFSALPFVLVCSMASMVSLAACGDNNGGRDQPDAGVDGPVAPKCFEGTPTTHVQLMNACVTADVEKIDKRPTLPLLNSDGTLPLIP